MKLNRNSLNKILLNSIQIDKKEYKLKSRGCSLYKKVDDYFVDIMISISGMQQEYIAVNGFVKPYIIDDIFWEVFHMSDNGKESMGLRANGAFKVDSLNVFSSTVIYGEIENIGTLAKKLLFQCHEEILNVIKQFKSFDDFLIFANNREKKMLFDYNLVTMLLLINEKKYGEARMTAEEMIANGKYGRFKNEGKYIYEHIVDYCNDKIQYFKYFYIGN